MNVLSKDDQPRLGLRERKKARTRATIRRHALRLFHEQGYASTTVEQIAEAAEISPSTFFRYFPTKEDVVLQDDLDELLIAAYKAQPPGTKPFRALRNAIHAVFASVTDDEREQLRNRTAMIFSTPELRQRTLDDIARMYEMLVPVIAARIDPPVDSIAVRTLTGTLIGVAVSVMIDAADDPDMDYLARFEEALGVLESGSLF